MTRKIDEYSNDVWDRFFDFVAPPLEEMTLAEVQSELKARRIDPTKAMARVREAIASAKAQAELEAARIRGPGIVERLNAVMAPKVKGLREQINQMIAKSLQGEIQLAYFRKLEEAADEQDLGRLMDDLARLDVLADDDESATEG